MIEKESVIEYIKQFESHTGILIDNVKQAYDIAVNICPEDIEDVLITEYKEQEGGRTFENFWFISKKYMLESTNIMKDEVNIDVVCYYHSIDRIVIKSRKYDYSKALDDSWLDIYGNITNLNFHLRSTGKNCDNLWRIFTKYLKPNLVEYIDLDKTST